MRTTLTIDDDLFAIAEELTGVHEKSALLRESLKALIELWQNLPAAIEANHQEALFLLRSHNLMGTGIGYVDLHLLASCLLATDHTTLWTRDKSLIRVAESLGLVFSTR